MTAESVRGPLRHTKQKKTRGGRSGTGTATCSSGMKFGQRAVEYKARGFLCPYINCARPPPRPRRLEVGAGVSSQPDLRKAPWLLTVDYYVEAGALNRAVLA